MTGALRCDVDSVADAQWLQIMSGFDDASIMQTEAYAAARWPRARLSHLLLRDGADTLAAAQVLLIELPLLRTGLAYVHFGPLWRKHGQPTANVAGMITALRREYVDTRGLLLRVKPNPERDRVAVLENEFATQGFARRLADSPDRFLVDLTLDAKQLKSGLHPKWRYNLKRSYSHGLEFAHRQGEPGLTEFLSLYRKMLRRKDFVDSSAIAELPAFYAALPPALRPQVVLCCRHGEALAGAVISIIGDTAQYLFGASDDRALALNAGYFLQWSAVEWLQGQSCRWYDLGGDSGSAGLRQFKAGLVGKSGRVVQLPGDFESSRGFASRATMRAAFGLREAYLASRSLWRRFTP